MRIRMALPSVALAAALASAPSGSAMVTPGSAAPLIRASAADVLAAVKAPGAHMVVVNVWATWCIPCREEMPDLLRLRRAYAERGLRLILVSGDFASDIGTCSSATFACPVANRRLQTTIGMPNAWARFAISCPMLP